MQTAVDYLIKQISEILGPLKTEGMTDLLLVDAIQKAKQMEKEQHFTTFEAGNKRGWSGYPNTDNWTQPTFEQYYN